MFAFALPRSSANGIFASSGNPAEHKRRDAASKAGPHQKRVGLLSTLYTIPEFYEGLKEILNPTPYSGFYIIPESSRQPSQPAKQRTQNCIHRQLSMLRGRSASTQLAVLLMNCIPQGPAGRICPSTVISSPE